MKASLANKIAIAIALSATPEALPQIRSPLPPKEKTQSDLGMLAKAAEKRLRKANKRIKAI